MMRRHGVLLPGAGDHRDRCHRPDDYLLGPSQADQVLSVTLSVDDPAGGRDLARHDHRAARSADRRRQAQRDVHHNGRHAHRRRQGRPVDHGAGRHQRQGRRRVAELHHARDGPDRRDGGLGLAQASVEFQRLAREQLFDVSLSGTSVPADGFSTIVITVTLKRLGTPQQRAVKFETSAGTLIAAGQTNSRAVTVTAERDGTDGGGASERDRRDGARSSDRSRHRL